MPGPPTLDQNTVFTFTPPSLSPTFPSSSPLGSSVSPSSSVSLSLSVSPHLISLLPSPSNSNLVTAKPNQHQPSISAGKRKRNDSEVITNEPIEHVLPVTTTITSKEGRKASTGLKKQVSITKFFGKIPDEDYEKQKKRLMAEMVQAAEERREKEELVKANKLAAKRKANKLRQQRCRELKYQRQIAAGLRLGNGKIKVSVILLVDHARSKYRHTTKCF